MMKLLTLLVFSAVLISAASAAPANVTVTGYGRVQHPSDTVSIAVSVSRTAPFASAARQNVSESVGRIITALSQVNGGNGTIYVTTTSLSISPATTYNSKTQVNTRTGYSMSQSVQVAIKNVTAPLLASVVDAIVGTGDVSISSINFGLTADTKKRMSVEGRTKAAEDATGTAKLYAQALGMVLGNVLELREVSVASSSVGTYSSDISDGPVETSVARAASIGEQSVTVSVVASFSLSALAVGTPASATGGK